MLYKNQAIADSWCYIVLTLCVTWCFSTNMDHDVSVEKLEQGAIFKKAGRVHNHLAYGHIHLALGMKGLIQRRKKLLDINKHVQNWNVYRIKSENSMHGMLVLREWVNRTIFSTTARIDAILLTLGGNGTYTEDRNLRKRDSEILNNISAKVASFKNPLKRQKRQLLIGMGGAIIGGFISSIVSSFSHETLMNVIQEKEGIMATQIENNLIKTNENSKDISRLAEAVSAIRNGMVILHNNTQRQMDTHTHMIHLLTTVGEEAHSVEKLVSAVEEARSGKFSLGLCKPQGLATALENLQKIGLQDGRSLGINTMLDLPHMPMSYVIDVEKQVLHAIVHVPMERSGNYLTILEYLDNPVQMLHKNRSPLYLEVDLKGVFLAVSGDQSRYMTYTAEDLRTCHHVQNEYFCDNLIIYKESRKSCIRALYDNEVSLIHSMCPMTIAQEVSKAIRFNGTTYIVTETTPQTITITCGEQKTTRKIKIDGGTYKIKLKKSCTLTTTNIIINHPIFEPEVEIEGFLNSNPLEFGNWMESHEMPEFLDTAKKYLDEIGQKVPVKEIKSLIRFKQDMKTAERQDWNAWVAGVHPGGLFSHVMTIIVIIIVVVVMYKIVLCFYTRKKSGVQIISWPQMFRRQNENNELNNRMLNRQASRNMRMSELDNDLSFENNRAEDLARERLQLEERRLNKEKRREEKRMQRETIKDMAMAAGAEVVAEMMKTQGAGALNPNLLPDTGFPTITPRTPQT